MAADAAALATRVKQLEKQCRVLQLERDELASDVEKLCLQAAGPSSKSSSSNVLNERISQASAEASKLRTALVEAEARTAEAEAERDGLQAEVAQALAANALQDRALLQAAQRCGSLEGAVASAAAERAGAQSQLDALRQQLHDLQLEHQATVAARDAAEAGQRDLQQALAQLQAEAAALRSAADAHASAKAEEDKRQLQQQAVEAARQLQDEAGTRFKVRRRAGGGREGDGACCMLHACTLSICICGMRICMLGRACMHLPAGQGQLLVLPVPLVIHGRCGADATRIHNRLQQAHAPQADAQACCCAAPSAIPPPATPHPPTTHATPTQAQLQEVQAEAAHTHKLLKQVGKPPTPCRAAHPAPPRPPQLRPSH